MRYADNSCVRHRSGLPEFLQSYIYIILSALRWARFVAERGLVFIRFRCRMYSPMIVRVHSYNANTRLPWVFGWAEEVLCMVKCVYTPDPEPEIVHRWIPSETPGVLPPVCEL